MNYNGLKKLYKGHKWQPRTRVTFSLSISRISQLHSHARMKLLLMVALLLVTGAVVDSASNKTNCDVMSNNSWCTQFSCVQPPCTMLCGLTSSYDVCEQDCNSSRCNALECRSSKSCVQSCTSGTCEFMTCDAKKHCLQSCYNGTCRRFTCSKTVKSCSQVSGSDMICEGDVCVQTCYHGVCRMTCPVGGTKCLQGSTKVVASMECDRGLCVQGCHDGRCNMNCSSSVTAGSCDQRCRGSCESMDCSARNCIQVAYGKNAVLHCDGETCQQTCSTRSENCHMTCSASVKECHQICLSGKCLNKCDAEKCTSQFPRLTAASNAVLQIGSPCVGGYMLALIIYKQLIF